jgi:hypothetical protein
VADTAAVPSKPFREDFYVKLLFVDAESRAAISKLLRTRVVSCERRLAELLDQRHQCDRSNPKKLVRWLFTEAAILHAEADLKAAELCRDVLVDARANRGDGSQETASGAQKRG